jgi:hypothetical protein
MIQPVFAFSYVETLEARAHEKNLASHPYWHRLLQYRRNLIGLYQSEISDPSFFLSPHGRRDPSAELDATLEAFFNPSPLLPLPKGEGEAGVQPAPCRYPARYAWLKEQLSLDPSRLPPADCSRYDKWKEQVDPKSVALVFASSYMNNPSSMYGHTFLLLHKKGHSEKEELLDYVVNFAADLEGDNGFLYAVKGLMGGYHGRFSTFPYYMKVQQYNNLESRDLWEYELHLSPAAIERLVEHLWELGNARLPYFFFNKNCAYYLMPLLEVAEPDRDFKKEFLFKAIPADTVRTVLRQPGLVGNATRRPSHASKLITERSRLTEPEIQLAQHLAVIPVKTGIQSWTPASAGVTTLEQLPPARRALVLDSAYDLFRYRYGFVREQPEEVQKKEQQLLLLRNQVTTGNEPPPNEGEMIVARPDAGHATGRVGLSYGFSNRSHFEELSLRPAIHDQDDPPEGYLPGSKLEMFDLKLRYDENRKTAYIQDFSLADIVSVTPWDRWIHPPSWKVNTGWRTANDLNRDPENSQYYGLNFGSGYAADLNSFFPSRQGNDWMLVYAMAETDLGVGYPFDDSVRFGGGPSGGLQVTPVSFWRARIQASYFPYVGTPSTTRMGLYQSLSITKTLELRVKVERQNIYKEVLLSLVLFL